MPLTSRERVNRMFARADHDRIPRYDSFWPDTIRRWQAEGHIAGEADIFAQLESDFFSAGVIWPTPFPEQYAVLDEDDERQIVRDAWGATTRIWKDRDGTPEHLAFDCDSPDKWESVYKPAFLDGTLRADFDTMRTNYARYHSAGGWWMWHCAESFEATRKLVGDEIILIAMATDPELVIDVSRTYTDQLLREFEVALTLGIPFDGVFMWGDMAYNRGTFCSPKMYRELIWPDHHRIAEWVHAHDMKLIYHTDGDVNRVVELYIEAGFDCLQPLEAKANMHLPTLVPQYSDQLAFMGNVDVMTMLDNDLERIEAEFTAKIEAGMGTRGYTYHSDHSIPPQVDWATYQFIIDLLNRCGNYT